jgi:hypothetical protein
LGGAPWTLTLICALKLPSTAAVGVTFTIPDPIPVKAVSGWPCVVDGAWPNRFAPILWGPGVAETLRVGAVGVSAPPQAKARRETPMAIPNRTWQQDM